MIGATQLGARQGTGMEKQANEESRKQATAHP
jgi:hypothetical protein